MNIARVAALSYAIALVLLLSLLALAKYAADLSPGSTQTYRNDVTSVS
jgi:hypothetical protein